jgi:hypothetical protein
MNILSGCAVRAAEQQANASPARLFRKKPVVIQAMPWDGTEASAAALCRWANDPPNRADDGEPWVDYVTEDGKPIDLMCHTLEGPLHVSPGDWIIRGVKGEFYPCKPDVFAATYEEVHSGYTQP